MAIVASLGLTYVLDNRKDKQDKFLRDMLKKQVDDTLDDTKTQLRDLRISQEEIKNKLVTQEKVEEVVSAKISAYQQQQKVEEVKR